MKNTIMLGTLTAVLLVLAPGAGAQETKAPAGMPVEFAKGTSTATLKGVLRPGVTAVYTVGALSGQLLEVRLDPKSNAQIKLVPPSSVESPMVVEQDGRAFSGRLPGTGQYLIQVSARASAIKAAVPYVIEVQTR
ncbi:hypothetical protein [Niveibacterium sp. SC-1]|uniref:hypothetical protein n=1 Tax=Niveibacterium sp. SC-1 TaxID=3135646 RepID=UPI00311EC893